MLDKWDVRATTRRSYAMWPSWKAQKVNSTNAGKGVELVAEYLSMKSYDYEQFFHLVNARSTYLIMPYNAGSST